MNAQIELTKKDMNQYDDVITLTVIIEERRYKMEISEGAYTALKDEFPNFEKSGQFNRDFRYY